MTDAVDISTVVLTPSNVRDFAMTKNISALRTATNGIFVEFNDADWPDIVPDTWGGPIYYTLWLGALLADGVVHMAASLNVFRGQQGAGAGDVTNLTIQPEPMRAPGQYANNLYYLDPALGQHSAVGGETLYAMVTAGGWRGIKAQTLSQRSNIVSFLASSLPKEFVYVDPIPTPVPTPVPVPIPAPQPPSDVLLKRIDDLEAANATRHNQMMSVLATLLAREYEATSVGSIYGRVTMTLSPKKK